jgi:hypothetical protein
MFQSQKSSVFANSFVIIPVVYILQRWVDLGVMKVLCSVLDTRIHHGMCSSTLPYASEKRCVVIIINRIFILNQKKIIFCDVQFSCPCDSKCFSKCLLLQMHNIYYFHGTLGTIQSKYIRHQYACQILRER